MVYFQEVWLHSKDSDPTWYDSSQVQKCCTVGFEHSSLQVELEDPARHTLTFFTIHAESRFGSRVKKSISKASPIMCI
ncbi:Hypothetical protein NTJ_10112 [Nesidiocoris tenuis]|uniref:Uncharacterized protein n=1 Tax=Nesidiocoris tenuis TaxID=355587 RepID=A0ABN7B3J0_9HEMI|nr:Hypothetical protein NTJ_10112 [Nesidiocoris tenuis]